MGNSQSQSNEVKGSPLKQSISKEQQQNHKTLADKYKSRVENNSSLIKKSTKNKNASKIESTQSNSRDDQENKQFTQQINPGILILQDKSFIQKIIDIYIPEQELNKISKEKLSQDLYKALKQCINKFKQKLDSKQIYSIMSEQQNLLEQKDSQLYKIALKNRIIRYLINRQRAQLKEYQISNEIQQRILLIGNTIIAEHMGKTNIWRSLMISKQEQLQKIIQMLHKQGVTDEYLNLFK